MWTMVSMSTAPPLKNKVTKLGDNNSDIISGDYHRTSVGHPIGSYYGYVQDGIFQTQEEIDNYYPMTWTAKPGDIRYKDLNGDKRSQMPTVLISVARCQLLPMDSALCSAIRILI